MSTPLLDRRAPVVISTRRVPAGVCPAPGATSTRPAWWGRDDWCSLEVPVAVWAHRDLCRAYHVSPDAVVKVARKMAAYANSATGRDCRPTNERLVVDAQMSLSTVQRARRVLKHLGLVVELVAGRSVMSRAERITAWRRGSSHRQVAAEFALCSRRDRAVDNRVPAHLAVERDTPTRSRRERGDLTLGRTHLRSQNENCDEERAPRAAPTKGVRRARRHDPSVRRLVAELQAAVPFLAGVSAARLVPLLTPYARADWTVRDFVLAIRDSMAARGWGVVPKNLTCPPAYLARLLESADPADRPSVLDDQLHAAEREHDRLSRHGAPCVHGVPGGDVASPLTGQRGCPVCRTTS